MEHLLVGPWFSKFKNKKKSAAEVGHRDLLPIYGSYFVYSLFTSPIMKYNVNILINTEQNLVRFN